MLFGLSSWDGWVGKLLNQLKMILGKILSFPWDYRPLLFFFKLFLRLSKDIKNMLQFVMSRVQEQ